MPVAFFVVYPYLKRVTWCHTWLGASLGLAPVGAWAAVTGELPWQAWALACSRALGRRVRPLLPRSSTSSTIAPRDCTRGPSASARRACVARPHHLAVVLLALAGLGLDVGALYWLGVAAVAVLLAYEHSLVRPGDLRRLDAAFFTINGALASCSSRSCCSTSPLGDAAAPGRPWREIVTLVAMALPRACRCSRAFP